MKFKNNKLILNEKYSLTKSVVRMARLTSAGYISRAYDGTHRIQIENLTNQEINDALSMFKNENIDMITSEERIFQNQYQMELVRKLHRIFFERFESKYFTSVKIIDIFPVVNFVAKSLDNQGVLGYEGTQSHLSHLWAYMVGRLDKKRRVEFLDFLERYCQQYMNRFSDLEEWSEILTVLPNVKQGVKTGGITFWSPYQFNPNNYATALHKATYANQTKVDLISHNAVLIFNRWYINILYENLTLLNLNIIDKYILNYAIASQRYDIRKSIEYYHEFGKEHIWELGE